MFLTYPRYTYLAWCWMGEQWLKHYALASLQTDKSWWFACMFLNNVVLICQKIYLSNCVQQILLNCVLASCCYTEYLLKTVCFWQSAALLGWLCVSVTSAALHLVLIGSKLITPLSVKQCCQTSPAQPCFHFILCSPADRVGPSVFLETAVSK